MIPEQRNIKEEYRIGSEIVPILLKYTVPLKANAKTNDDEIGTGVFLEIANRLFLLSVAHCLENDPVVLLNEDFTLPPTDIPLPILKKTIHPEYDFPRHDVGFLELKNVAPRLPIHRTVLSQIRSDPIPANQPFLIVGCPVDRRKHDRGRLDIAKATYQTIFSHEEDGRLFFEFPKEWSLFNPENDEFNKSDGYKSPIGFSGGGLWGILQTTDTLFTFAKHVALFGLQSAWLSQSRKVICFPIRCWMRLLYDAYPELQEEMKAGLPKAALDW